ncbi:Calx-beta domain-containing protein [Sulfurospirillum arcachonense]|uniref:Calx-beta domain-containing protein n=1 Tax=Sulfurospirillum arcachonense TaxID=57666 RepID=UPI00046A7C7F|nr:Calx-beta domain-containing protein [Sulfurospirillum arcachonense]
MDNLTKKSNFLYFLFLRILFILFLSQNFAFAITVLDSDDFNDGTTMGWSNASNPYTNSLKIERDVKSSKTFNLGAAYANEQITIKISMWIEGGWENSGYSQDWLNIWANGNQILHDGTLSGYSTYQYDNITAVTDATGSLTITIQPDTTGDGENVFINNFSINRSAISIYDKSQPEGDSDNIYNIHVTLNEPQTQTVTIDYKTANGTALAGSDYNTTQGTLTFTPSGPLTQDINVTIFGDITPEEDEIFYIDLDNPSNITLSDSRAMVTIKNDDTGYCKSAGLSEGYHVVAPDGNEEHSFEIYCDLSDPDDIKDILKLPLSKEMSTTEFSNFKFMNDLGSDANYYDDSHSKKYFNYIRINANTLEIIPYDAPGYYDGDFSNINLKGTPFTFDWDNIDDTNIEGCSLNKMRRDYDPTTKQGGQVLKINPKEENVPQCSGKKLRLKLLDDYKFLIYENKEVLTKSCRKISEMLPDSNEYDNITGYFYVDPKLTGRTNNQSLSDYRPFVAYCMEVEGANPEDQYSWTMFLTLDGDRTENHEDIKNKQDTCSNLGLFFFVPNSEITFNKAKKFLYDQKAQWAPYTGTMGEYFSDRDIDGWGTSHLTNFTYWPYGPMGLYYDDGDSTDGVLDPGSAGSWGTFQNGVTIDGKKYGYDLTSSSEINGISINIAHLSTGTGWQTTLEEMGYSDDFWITTYSAGSFENSSGSSGSIEPNGDYTYGNWMHFWADDNGTIVHYNDQGYDGTINDRYRHDHYICMAKDNYQFVRRYRTSPGPYNVVNQFSSAINDGKDPLEESDVKNALLTQIANKSFGVQVLRLEDNDLITLTNSEDSIFLDLVNGENIDDDPNTCKYAPKLDNTDIPISFNNKSNVLYTNKFDFTAKEATYRIKYIDWGKMFLGSGITCARVSNMSSNLRGVPQCLSNASNILALFAHESNGYDVSICTDGNNRACDPEMYAGGELNTAKDSIVPEKYNHKYGCLACLLDIAASYTCARDNFSIRPDTYYMDMNETKLIGGKPYKLDINATSFNIPKNNVTNYTQTIDNSTNRYAEQQLDVNASCTTLFPAAKQFLASNIIFSDGKSQTYFYTYPDVGDVNITINDSEWTGIDQAINNGKSFNDCIINSDTNVTDTNGKIGCSTSGTKQFVFSPKAFINTLTLQDFDNGNFTYISNDRNMSARLLINIKAILDDNKTALNYTANCFSKDINTTVTLINDVNATEWLTNDDNATQRIIFFDDKNVTTTRENNNTSWMTLSSKEGNFTNGTANINVTFNFRRAVNNPDEPFHIQRDDFNITVIDTNNTNGSDFNRTANDYNATFYYGRVYADDKTYIGNNGQATVYYEIYSTSNANVRTNDFNITGNESVEDINWYNNTQHTDTIPGDYNSTPPSSNDGTIIAIINYNTLALNANAPHKDKITLTPHPWLVHDAYDNNATTTDFLVEFFGIGQWAGEGKLGDTVDVNISTRQNRSLDW